jgi:hypothetical protein
MLVCACGARARVSRCGRGRATVVFAVVRSVVEMPATTDDDDDDAAAPADGDDDDSYNN